MSAATEPVVADQMWRLPPGAVALHGHLGDEMALCLQNRVLAQDVTALVRPMIARTDVTEWRSEFWGKWITSAITAYRWNQSAELKAKISDAVAQLIAAQDAQGYIGAYSPANRLQRWDVWGRKYTLLGLLAWHEASGDPAALAAARREADFLLTEVGPGKGNPFKHDMWNGMATSSVLEPIVLLANRTGDRRYLEFAQWLVGQWQESYGPDLVRKALAGTNVFDMFAKPDPAKKGYGAGGSSKAYEMMSCYEGLLELYRATGTAMYREAAEKVFANIRDTEITIIGSGSDWERWSNGRMRQTEPWQKGMETCVTVTWIKFAAQLLRLTGDPAYADQIELSTYNALLGALGSDGQWWAHHIPLAGVKERAPEQCDMVANCCVENGPRALMLLPELAVMQDRAGPVVNLYGTMTATVPIDGDRRVQLEMESDYPRGDTVKIRVTPDRRGEFTLSLRIPAWSQRTEVAVNGEKPNAAPAGAYLRLQRTWQPGDGVTLKFDLSPRVVRAPGAEKFAALMRGPIVLAQDARRAAPRASLKLAVGAAGALALRVERPQSGSPFWLLAQVPVDGGGTVAFCDFASAGNTWSDASAYRVWFEAP